MKKSKFIKSLFVASAVSVAAVGLASCSKKKPTEPTEVVDSIRSISIEAASKGNKDIYVSPTGKKSGDGSKEKPYDFVTATTKVEPGTNIILAAGTYKFGERIPVGKENNYATADQVFFNGAPGNFVTVQPEKDKDGNYGRVVFDFSQMLFDDANRGVQVYGNYWYFYGIEVTGAGDNGMYIAGSHNIVDRCLFYNNRDTGLQIGRGGGSQETLDQWPGYNLVRNCTSFANYDDVTLGENADGFAAKLTVGHCNIFDGCIAFRNSDDGWDLYAKQDSGNIGTVILYNCVSFENGFLPFQAQPAFATDTVNEGRAYDTQNGDGIGFKLGGSTMTGDVIMENCLAFNNKYHGVSDNSNPGFLSLRNVTTFNNCIGLGLDGKVTDTRGISYATNKSNNIDLARTIGSYNDFYGIVSYVNNQSKYVAEGDNMYNADMFRGSTAYSIFQTSYDSTEKYVAFKDVVDGSSYHTDSQDIPFNGGTEYTGLSDASFADLTSINAICDSRDTLSTLLHYDTDFRNPDGSVNMGNKIKIVDEKLLTFANGQPIGANLSKSSLDEYTHPEYFTFETANKDMSSDMEKVLSTYMALKPITNLDCTFQDFDITNLMNGCEITWESSNTDVIQILTDETVSKSMSVEAKAHVMVPSEITTVKLTATIKYATATIKKEFDIKVYPRNQYLGELDSTGADVLRVSIYSTYYPPRVYAVDASSINRNEIDPRLYDLTYTYEYASDGNSKFFPVDDVYTSVPGVYRITAKAVSKLDSNQTSSYTFHVYVVDPDCSIDFIGQESQVVLSADGFAVTGNLSNIEGYVKAVVSETDLGTLTPEQIVNNPDVQSYKISTDKVVAQFKANNSVTTPVAYYIYYTVVNDNMSNLTTTTAYKNVVNTKAITSKAEFTSLARKGTPDGTDYSSTLTIFYLTTDLDFENSWDTTTTTSAFNGLFNGNNHTISNIVVNEKPATAHYVNVFYKVANGSIMNVTFDNIHLTCQDSSNGKRMGVIGSMNGGYIENVKITNSSFVGYESVGGLVGQVTGGDNFFNRCQLINPTEFFTPVTGTFEADTQYYRYIYQDVDNTYNYVAVDLEKDEKFHVGETIPTGEKDTDKVYVLPHQYTITSKNKYQAGLVGNAQIADSSTYLNITMTNCYVKATIGDGNDTGGNTGGILGRCKNDSDKYTVNLNRNFYEGYIISKGLYGAGILGDLDNGLGYINVDHNFSFVIFVYKGQYIDPEFNYRRAYEAGGSEALADVQKFAHKNLNPIIGRATSSDAKLYNCPNNYGNWKENYSKLSISLSAVFDIQYVDEEREEIVPYRVSDSTFGYYLDFDIKNIWIYDSTTQRVTLR